jgi:hypothetical protein
VDFGDREELRVAVDDDDIFGSTALGVVVCCGAVVVVVLVVVVILAAVAVASSVELSISGIVGMALVVESFSFSYVLIRRECARTLLRAML